MNGHIILNFHQVLFLNLLLFRKKPKLKGHYLCTAGSVIIKYLGVKLRYIRPHISLLMNTVTPNEWVEEQTVGCFESSSPTKFALNNKVLLPTQ